MRNLYSHPNAFLVQLAKSMLMHNDIEVVVEASFSGPQSLSLPPGEKQTILLFKEPFDEAFAQKLLKSFEEMDEDEVISDWYCDDCSENNDPSFEWCWHCHADRYTNIKH